MKLIVGIRIVGFLTLFQTAETFQVSPSSSSAADAHRTLLPARNNENEGGVEEYKNAATSFLSNFMQRGKIYEESPKDPLGGIDFAAPKIGKKNLATLASMLDSELYEKEWFVTGRVNPSFFADDFEFQDPDVKLSGIEGAFGMLGI